LEGLVEEVDKMMDIAVKAHLQKKASIARMLSGPGEPLWQLGKIANDGRPYLRLEDCVYIIGMIGMNDAVQYLTGKQFHESQEAVDMGLKVIAHMYLRTKEYSEKYGLTFKLEESPAESAARRLAKADLQYFREDALKVYKGGNEDFAYYTNSIHIAAGAPTTLVERIRTQSMFHNAIESGAIIHAFIGEEQPDPVTIGELVRQVYLNTQAAQLTFSPEFTYCLDCGAAQRGLEPVCNQCGSQNVVGETRVVGYFARVQNFNKSKRYGELPDRHAGDYAVSSADAEEAK
jgi:ribonucleoside-triphosphate reductase